MLHIVNGDVVGETLRQGIVQGDVLVWREIYCHGPVFAAPAVEENVHIRARYLEQSLGIPAAEFITGSQSQEQFLANVQQYEEVVLWFEHDLFDQTMLSYLLYRLSGLSLPSTKLSLLCIGEYPGIELFHGLGQLNREQMATLAGTWQSIGAEELQLGAAFWQAYASPEPLTLQSLLATDTSAQPFAHAAFKAHLSRFPSTRNGLGIVEQTTLERVQAGTRTAYGLFAAVTDLLHGLGMGDLQYRYLLLRMSQGTQPLLEIGGKDYSCEGNPFSTPFQNDPVALTELGRNVLEGRTDWLALQGADEWYGGVHVHGHAPRWRWDADRQVIQDTSAGDMARNE